MPQPTHIVSPPQSTPPCPPQPPFPQSNRLEKKTVEDTETVFWSNLEGGLSLLAVNLPSLWAIVGTISAPASQLVASIRSALSLRSLGGDSNRSSRRAVAGQGGVDGANASAHDSQVRIHETGEGQGCEWHGMGQLGGRETEVDVSGDSDGAEYSAKRADYQYGMV